MSWTVVEEGSVEIDLVALANTTGWSGSGNTATHDICNAGYITLMPPPGLTITAGQEYQFSFFVHSISGGYVQASIGNTEGDQITTTGFVLDSLVASGATPKFRFYSNAACVIEVFVIGLVEVISGAKQRNTIAYSERLDKWTSFYTYNPDTGFGLFIKLYTVKAGNLYVHDKDGTRNQFYGTQYQSILKFVSSAMSTIVKNFQTVNYQANTLLVTTEDGVETSLGQVSELIASDFLNYALIDGIEEVRVYDREGQYQASFQRDKNSESGIINGDTLRGNYITCELVTTENVVLKLFTVGVQSAISKTGIR